MSSSIFHSFIPKLSNGTPFPFEQLKGQIVLIVNTATGCGFAKQFAGLQDLHNKWPGRFQVIGFPSADFSNQEKVEDADMQDTCKLNHGVSFPLMQRSHVNGPDTNEVFKYLKSQASGLFGLVEGVTWNFAKFLVDGEGKVIHRYAPTTTPEDLVGPIEKLLAMQSPNLNAKDSAE